MHYRPLLRQVGNVIVVVLTLTGVAVVVVVLHDVVVVRLTSFAPSWTPVVGSSAVMLYWHCLELLGQR